MKGNRLKRAHCNGSGIMSLRERITFSLIETLDRKSRVISAMRRCFFIFAIMISVFACSVIKEQIPVSRDTQPAIVLPGAPTPYIVNGVTYYPLPDGEGFVQEGMASWYGRPFHGRRASSGEIFDMHDNTAAHKTLPFGTYVKVENRSTHREVIVRINDRGPFVKERIIDLSYAAGKAIGLIGPGVEPVRLVALSKEVGKIRSGNTYKTLVEAKDLYTGKFTIQVGAFENAETARRLKERLSVIFDSVTITTYMRYDDITFYRVRVSLSDDLTKAGHIVERLEYLGFSDVFIVAL